MTTSTKFGLSNEAVVLSKVAPSNVHPGDHCFHRSRHNARRCSVRHSRPRSRLIRDAALAGLGVALVPLFIVYPELRSGALKALDVGYEPEGADVYIAYPRDRVSPAKLLTLTRHLRLAFGNPPQLTMPRGEKPV
jgi:DNA-binding transcriptional LysR family regulator